MKKPLMLLTALLIAIVAAGILGSTLRTSPMDESGADAMDADSGAARSSAEPAVGEVATLRDATAEAGTTQEQLRESAVIRTASVGIDSDRMGRDLALVRSVATSLKGSVASENTQGSGEHAYAELTLRVPNDTFDTAMSRLGEIGTVTHREVSTDDVTTQVIDVDARVRAQRASVNSLQRLMDKARTVGEVMSVERELAQRQGDLDSLLQQQRYLADQTSMSTISVSISEEAEEAEEAGTGFVDGLSAGWGALGAFLAAAAMTAGALLPFVPVVALVGVPIWLVIRRRRRAAVAVG